VGVRLSFVDVQFRLDARLSQLAMDPHGVAEEQVAGEIARFFGRHLRKEKVHR
jgi:hypothetical protein